MLGQTVPPVADCNGRATRGHRETLLDTVVAGTIAALECAVVASVRVRRVDDFVTA